VPDWRTVAGELPELLVADAAAWRTWLGEHHTDPGVWLVLAKKGTLEPTRLSYDDALPEALCHGWIDGQVGRRDAGTYRQRFTPRRPRSAWSRRNVGLAEVQRARADGRWDSAYAGPATIEVPVDLAAALAAQPAAQAMFDILTSQNRFAVLHRVGSAKRADTRARRIEQFVAMLARGETIYPQKRTS
jgi:uncharacterized protein YdeI (YjbR/CyaY-like superfamily)